LITIPSGTQRLCEQWQQQRKGKDVDEKPKEKLTWAELRAKQEKIYAEMIREIEEQEKATNWPAGGRVIRDEKSVEWAYTEHGTLTVDGLYFHADRKTPVLDENGKQRKTNFWSAAALEAQRVDNERWELAGKLATGWTPEPPLELAPEEETYEYTDMLYSRIGPERLRQKYTVACSHCPASVWHINRENWIRVFCSIMRVILVLNQPQYGERMTFLKECSGRREALEAWREEQRKQEEA
jgi:hypothetical protein